MNFSTTETHESQAEPGVRFTVRVLNRIQRAGRDMELLKHRERLTQIQSEIAELIVEKDNGPGQPKTMSVKPGAEVRMAVLSHESTLIEAQHVTPAYIRAGLVSVEGYDIDGQPATVETIISGGSDALLDEIYTACSAASGLSAEQRKNSQPAGTSPAPEGTPAGPTTATPAANPAST